MPLHFRPMIGLTIVMAICLPILLGLGLWQYQRWQWKQGVLAEIEAAVTAPPLTGIAELDALPDEAPIDFRRIALSGEAIGPVWYLYRPQGAIAWQPFREVISEGRSTLVAFPVIDDRVKETAARPDLSDMRAGYVRRIRAMRGLERWVAPDNNPDENRWFSINPDGAWMDGADYYIDLDATERDATALPVRRPDIPNNHVSYMLTWWSFAIIFLVIYLMLHKRAGRLGWS